MSDIVIKAQNLSKRYRLGEVHGDLLSEKIGAGIRSFFNLKPNTPNLKRDTTFWALKEVSFEVKQGEVVGIIGGNGAGKSTLLKILSRITEPTGGYAEIYGRVGSLLEVGTGFHPELTGRENIFLNGAILGMKKAEIRKRFDEIVAFAEVEKFIDTPVKHYSSGMYVRLAFAVAAHLEPEILIVDEVLAVGDAAFQKKCLGKMEDVSKTEGRTVLFVSHNMAAVKSLCERVVFLDGGRVVMDSRPDKVVDRYLGDPGMKVSSYRAEARKKAPCFTGIELIQEERRNGAFAADRSLRISFKIDAAAEKGLDVNLFIRNEEGVCIHHSSDSFEDSSGGTGRSAEPAERLCELPAYGLAAGKYRVDVSLTRREFEVFDYVQDALVFETGFTDATSERGRTAYWRGVCGPGLIKWE